MGTFQSQFTRNYYFFQEDKSVMYVISLTKWLAVPGGKKYLWKSVWRAFLLGILSLAVVLGYIEWISIPIANAQTGPKVTVRVVIERVVDQGCFEYYVFGCGDPDFYAVVNIDGQEFETQAIIDDGWIEPNWQFSLPIDFTTRRTIPITIDIYDEDGGLRINDDHADITIGSGHTLQLTVDLSSCSVSGEIAGGCGESLTSHGHFGDDYDEDASIEFYIEVDYPFTPGLQVQCLHNPIWPQATDTVTFTATALDRTLNSKIVDTIEIYVNNHNTPVQTCSTDIDCSINLNSFTGSDDFFYGCHIQNSSGGFDETAWSGWRRVAIGIPALERAVPIIYTGTRDSSIDIVFIPDQASYPNGGVNDANFRNDVASVIQNGYYAEDVFLRNQQDINFWIARDTGIATSTAECRSPAKNCHQLPNNWNGRDYSFADVGAIIHRNITDTLGNDWRNYAQRNRRVFSAQWNNPRIFLHESGHQPFGLADEYPGDSGYFQNNQFPNIYTSLTACQNDPLAATASDTCQSFTSASGETFFRLDSNSTIIDDLMVTNGTPQLADTRRINWLFERCRSGDCNR